MSAKYLAIDLEMTGLEITKHHVIQIGAAITDQNFDIISTFNSYVSIEEKDYDFSIEAQKINQISRDTIDSAPNKEEVVGQFLEFISSEFITTQPIFVGQFFPSDYLFLNILISKTSLYDKWQNYNNNSFIDTKSLVLNLNAVAESNGEKLPFPVTSLNKPNGLKDCFNITQDSHDAMGDIRATLDVLKSINKGITYNE